MSSKERGTAETTSKSKSFGKRKFVLQISKNWLTSDKVVDEVENLIPQSFKNSSSISMRGMKNSSMWNWEKKIVKFKFWVLKMWPCFLSVILIPIFHSRIEAFGSSHGPLWVAKNNGVMSHWYLKICYTCFTKDIHVDALISQIAIHELRNHPWNWCLFSFSLLFF